MTKAACLLALTLIAAHCFAEDYLSPTEERVRLSLGATYVSSTTDVRVDSSTGVPGTFVNAEDQFGLDKSDVEPKFQAMLRVGERNRIRIDYFTLDRTGSTTVTQPIQFRDVELLNGDPLKTHLSMDSLGLTYEFSFLHRQRYELAATVGINETDISARAQVSTSTRHVNQTEDAAGPFPTVGLDGTWVLSKRFYVDARGQYMRVNIHELNGSLGFYEVAAMYRLRPNIALALGYNLTKANLNSTQPRQSGLFDFNTKGPEAFVRVAF